MHTDGDEGRSAANWSRRPAHRFTRTVTAVLCGLALTFNNNFSETRFSWATLSPARTRSSTTEKSAATDFTTVSDRNAPHKPKLPTISSPTRTGRMEIFVSGAVLGTRRRPPCTAG